MKLFLIYFIGVIAVLYFVLCIALYFLQEKLIFHPEQLPKDYHFLFDQSFEEKNIKLKDGVILNGVLFKAENSKGLIFYLHGNAGSLASWGYVADVYTNLNYDVFMLDYRGYGKSEGVINNEKKFYEDVQTAYDEMKKSYNENQIIVLGYSIGTGAASQLASVNNPRLLILQAPYYNLADLVKRIFPFVPSFMVRYKFETNEHLKDCQMPVVVFHGDEDEVIYYGSSLKLQNEFKSGDRLFTLEGESHNNITSNPEYIREMEKILK